MLNLIKEIWPAIMLYAISCVGLAFCLIYLVNNTALTINGEQLSVKIEAKGNEK